MKAALVILGNDLRQRMRDRSALLTAFVVPMALATIFGLTLHNASSGKLSFDYALVDRDGGSMSHSFRTQVLAPLESRGLVRLRESPGLAEAKRLVSGGDVAAAFVLPHGLSAAVAAGRSARIDVLGNADAQIGTLVAHSIARAFADRVGSVRLSVATVLGGPPRGAEGRVVVEAASAQPAAVIVNDVSTRRKNLDMTTFYAAGMAVFFLFYSVQLGVSSLLDERRDGTLFRMLAAPIPRRSILVGKFLTSISVGVISMGVLAVATHFLLGAHWGNPLGVALLIAAGVLAATSIMALIATLAKTQDQVGAWQSMVALVLGMLGGSFFPVAQAGGWLAAISKLTPHAWFLRGLENLSGGGGVEQALGPAGVIVVFALVAGGIAFLRVGKLVEP
ncbi:MAG: ABC transporter permease [Gaiellaceae bacterium]